MSDSNTRLFSFHPNKSGPMLRPKSEGREAILLVLSLFLILAALAVYCMDDMDISTGRRIVIVLLASCGVCFIIEFISQGALSSSLKSLWDAIWKALSGRSNHDPAQEPLVREPGRPKEQHRPSAPSPARLSWEDEKHTRTETRVLHSGEDDDGTPDLEDVKHDHAAQEPPSDGMKQDQASPPPPISPLDTVEGYERLSSESSSLVELIWGEDDAGTPYVIIESKPESKTAAPVEQVRVHLFPNEKTC
uniref:Transmembrane protein n=1 Tax=Lotharella globosa TaxID=91324 RepID=A0A6V3L2P3_9EUKA